MSSISPAIQADPKPMPPFDQLALFESGPVQLAQDEEGGIVYRPGFLTHAEAEHAFEALREQIEWHHQSRRMYEREVEVPRLTAHFDIDGNGLHPVLRFAAERVGEATGVRYTHVGLNYYRDGRDSVAPHHDRLEDLKPGYPIALLSVGSVRRMRISSQSTAGRSLQIDLEPGSLLIMSYASQLQWLHGIPKRPGLQPPRISIGFRVRQSVL